MQFSKETSHDVRQTMHQMKFLDSTTESFAICTYEKGDIFGVCALVREQKGHYKRPYRAKARTNLHVAVFSKKSFERILDRFYKKFLLKETNFLRSIEQLRSLSKRILSRINNQLKTHKYKRGMTIYKEGDEAEYVYIIKEGEVEVKKYVYESKMQRVEYELLQNP